MGGRSDPAAYNRVDATHQEVSFWFGPSLLSPTGISRDDCFFMNNPFSEHRVLLTGAGGSIGSALAQAIMRHHPRSLILLDHSEHNLYQIEFDLSSFPNGHVCLPVLGDICDSALLSEIFERHQPEVLIHAAAFKQVPLIERNPISAVRNNAIATNRLAKMARKYEAANVTMVSTDKAVEPRSVMGATKRVAELALLRWSNPCSVMKVIRLGNVLGSQGSVLPTFARQIAAGGPVTVTHPDAARYFLGLSESVESVIAASALEGDAGLFVPDLGEPIRILDLARQTIRQTGCEPDKDIPIIMTGLRPGEKLTERLISKCESVDKSFGTKLRRLKTPQPSATRFDELMAEMENNTERRDLTAVLAGLCRLVPEYRPSEAVVALRNGPAGEIA
jgi:FlaA1/EpsC-like NDP-sugar epimerase